MNQKIEHHATSFTGLLTIAFIVLKLVGTITWSWWWVLSPLWIPIVFVLGMCLVIMVSAAIVSFVAAFVEKIR